MYKLALDFKCNINVNLCVLIIGSYSLLNKTNKIERLLSPRAQYILSKTKFCVLYQNSLLLNSHINLLSTIVHLANAQFWVVCFPILFYKKVGSLSTSNCS